MKRSTARSPAPPLAGRLLLLLALSLVMAPQLLQMPFGLSLAVVAALSWRLQRDLHGWPLPPVWVKLPLALAFTVGVYGSYRTVIGAEAGSALLTLLLCMKLLELKSQRDAMVSLFLGYFLAVTGFLHSQSIFMGLYLFATVLALTTALVAMNHLAPTLASSRAYLRHASGLLLQSLPLMVVLFLLFPRLQGSLWTMPESRGTSQTGLSERLEIGTISRLVESQAVAFRVEFDGPLPAADRLYWRGPVLWHTDGREWTRLPREMRLRHADSRPRFTPRGEAVDYAVTLEPHNRRWIFALDLPAALPQITGKVMVTPGLQLNRAKPVDELLRYRLRSHTDYRTGPLAAWERRATLQLPAGANPESRFLAEEWRDDGLEEVAIIERALSLFRDQPFYYSRTPPLLTGDHPVDRFLFESRRGFCEHYAAAFTTLMRAAGIPARIVTGYQGGELNPLGGHLVIRQSDAHAWSEVWLADRGWVRVDPTAMVPPERVETDLDLNRFSDTGPPPLGEGAITWLVEGWRNLRNGWDAINHGWNHWVLGFDRSRQRALLESLGLGKVGWRGMVGLLAALLGLALMLVALYLLRQRPRHDDPLQRRYLRFCERLGRIGLPRATGEGAGDYALRVIGTRPDLTREVQAITGLYQRLRYGANASAGDLDEFERRVAAFRPGRERE